MRRYFTSKWGDITLVHAAPSKLDPGRVGRALCEALKVELLTLALEYGVEGAYIDYENVILYGSIDDLWPLVTVRCAGGVPVELPDVPGVPGEPAPGGMRAVGRRLVGRGFTRVSFYEGLSRRGHREQSIEVVYRL